MQGPIVEQLLEAGLVTETQAREVSTAEERDSTSYEIKRLVAKGLDERMLAGFFVSKGFGPMLQAAELSRVDLELARRLPPTEARQLCAMPLRPSAAGAVVAMANPTDALAVERVGAALGGRILPTVAKLSDLLAAIERVYGTDRPTGSNDPTGTPSGVMPLVQQKQTDTSQTHKDLEPPADDFTSTASPVWDRAWSRTNTEREVSLTPRSSRVPSHIPLPSLSPATPSAPESSVPDSAIDARLHELSRVESRDEAVRIACQASATRSRGTAFLALRKGVFRGWDGVGEDVTSAGIRSLWVPASNPSMLNEALHTSQVFRGAYGETAADHLFRAAFGTQGREVVICPVLVGRRMVGVLCANDPRADSDLFERIASALGHAFERLIVSHKSGS